MNVLMINLIINLVNTFPGAISSIALVGVFGGKNSSMDYSFLKQNVAEITGLNGLIG